MKIVEIKSYGVQDQQERKDVWGGDQWVEKGRVNRLDVSLSCKYRERRSKDIGEVMLTVEYQIRLASKMEQICR